MYATGSAVGLAGVESAPDALAAPSVPAFAIVGGDVDSVRKPPKDKAREWRADSPPIRDRIDMTRSVKWSAV